jgi:hypothetical protein
MLEPLAFRPVIILINRYILRILLHIFLMKFTIMRSTRKDDFRECAHFLPEGTYTGNKPAFGVRCGGSGATG